MATKIELLSPAKNSEYGMAAINCGADAVYIGAPRFGARASAGNSISEIEKLCQYAHLYHAKVHVALNTILTDDEIPPVPMHSSSKMPASCSWTFPLSPSMPAHNATTGLQER